MSADDLLFFGEQFVDVVLLLLEMHHHFILFMGPSIFSDLERFEGFFHFGDEAGAVLLFFFQALGMLLFALSRVESDESSVAV